MAISSNNEIEKKLWAAADQLRANSQLSSQEYSAPVLGLIFLRYTDHKFTDAEKEITKKQPAGACDCLLPKLISGEIDVSQIG